MNKSKGRVLKERHFECRMCGHCCSQRVLIYPSLEEIQNLSRYFNISEGSFALRYLEEVYDPQKNAYAIAFKTNHPDDTLTGCIYCQDNLSAIHSSPWTNLCNLFPWNHFDYNLPPPSGLQCPDVLHASGFILTMSEPSPLLAMLSILTAEMTKSKPILIPFTFALRRASEHMDLKYHH